MTEEKQVTIRTCGFAFTTTGRPCANHVADDELYCRAGHPCATGTAHRDHVGRWRGAPGHRLGRSVSAVGPGDRLDRRRRAIEAARPCPVPRGCRGRRYLCRPDPGRSGRRPGPSRFAGRRPRGPRCRRPALRSGRGAPGGRPTRTAGSAISPSCRATPTPRRAGDEVSAHLERLVKHFAHLDARKLGHAPERHRPGRERRPRRPRGRRPSPAARRLRRRRP